MAKFIPQNKLFNDYEAFVDKFKPKKTTDDCYTPTPIYETVLDWVRHNLPRFPDGANIVRPFYPGEDYRERIYEDKDVVVDNPPFSIISQIVDFYIHYSIPFFLFAPHLTLFGIVKEKPCNAILTDADIIYENGAVIKTSFVTNMDSPDIRFRTAPDLKSLLECVSATNKPSKSVAKIIWPQHVVSAALLGKVAKIKFAVSREESAFVRHCGNKNIFGGGYLISNQAAAEKAAAEKAAAEKAAAEKAEQIGLTSTEMAIIENLSNPDKSKSTT